MTTDINALDSLVSILSTNYITANVDNITPVIAKIYTKPSDKEPRPNQDFIYLYSEITNHNSVGLGYSNVSEVTEVLKIDIRSKPSNSKQANLIVDAHARKVLTEVKRVLFSKIINPDSNFDVIDPQLEITDLSNGARGVFRYIIKVRLIDYCRDMTS